jgi:nucleoside-diphosphate-sugar epimerase
VSTTAVYETADIAPIREDFPLDRRPNAPPYVAGKVAAEEMLLRRHREQGIPLTIVRPSYVYGPHNNLINREFSYFLRLTRGRPILIPDDGLTLLHLGHVDDLTSAILATWEQERAMGQAFNVTGAEAVTIQHYVRTLADVVGVPAKEVYLSREQLAKLERPIFPFEWRRSIVYDISKAKQALDWAPQYHLEAGMAQTYAWFRERGLGEDLAYDFTFEDTVLARFAG